MAGLTRYLFPALLLLSVGLLSADSGTDPDDAVLEKVKRHHGVVDWTRLTISTTGTAPVNRDSSRYPLELQIAYSRARRNARQRLYMMLLEFRVDDRRDIRQLLADNPGMRNRLQNHIYQQAREVVPPYRRGRAVHTRASIRLTGSEGLYSLFPELYPFFRVLPDTVFLYRGGYHYTGLVIDARHLPLKPSSGLRIFNEKGLLIFSPAFTRRSLFRNRGHLQYLTGLGSPLLKRRVGVRYLYFLAKSLRPGTPAGSDIVVHDRDGDRILSSKTLHDAVKQCRVVVLCKPPGN